MTRLVINQKIDLPALLLLVPLLLAPTSTPRAAADQTAEGKARPGMAVWDTNSPMDRQLSANDVTAKPGWEKVSEKVTAGFRGDAVVTNGRIVLVVRKRDSAAEVYTLNPQGMSAQLRLRLLADKERPATQLEDVRVIENTKSAASLEVTYKTADATQAGARLRIKNGDVNVQVEPRQGAERLRLECPSRFVVLPDFFADDILIDARAMPLSKVGVPGESPLLHLGANGDALTACVFDNRKQDVFLSTTGAGEQRALAATEIPFEGKKIWLATQKVPGMWHTREVATDDAGKELSLDWRFPFLAHWRVDFTCSNDLADSWDLLLQRADGHYVKPTLLGQGAGYVESSRIAWTPALQCYAYPCWSDREGRGYLEPLKSEALQFRGPVVIYPLNRTAQTPVDVFTVLDIMRNALGIGPCERILEQGGQKGEFRGLNTCAVRAGLERIYGPRQQKEMRQSIESLLDDALVFVTHIRGRIDCYIQFNQELRLYLAEQKKKHPDWSEFLEEMDQISRQMDERIARRADKIKTPGHVAKMNEDFRSQLLDYDGPDAGERCLKYTAALVEIGDNQDVLAGECRWVVKNLCQRAGIRSALDPRLSTVGNEIRKKARQALCNPAAFEAKYK